MTHAVVRVDGYRPSKLIGLKLAGEFTVFAVMTHDVVHGDGPRAADEYGAWCSTNKERAWPKARVAWVPVAEVDCPECAAHVAASILQGDHNGLGYTP